MKLATVTAPAEADLLEIVQGLLEQSVPVASGFIDRFEALQRNLGEFPHIGHRHAHVADERLRVVNLGRWLVVYRPDLDPPSIARILDGTRDVAAILGRA